MIFRNVAQNITLSYSYTLSLKSGPLCLSRMLPRWKRNGRLRQKHAIRSSTWKNYISSFKLFLLFCFRFHVDPLHCNMDVIAAFTEMLIENHYKGKNIINKLTGIKTCFKWIGCNLALIHSNRWTWNYTSVDKTLRDDKTPPSSMNIEHLKKLLVHLGSAKKWISLKVLLCFGFFGLFRLSNMVPNNRKKVDPHRNTLIGDVLETKFGLVVRLKWTKTRQRINQYALVPLPKLKDKTLCPVTAWETYKKAFPEYCSDKTNLLLTKDGSKDNFWTSGTARKYFKLNFAAINLYHLKYTPHSLRRGGAAYLFNAGISTEAIRQHGLWSSDSIDSYLRNNLPKTTKVINCFQDLCI